jgi:hypothetical protein
MIRQSKIENRKSDLGIPMRTMASKFFAVLLVPVLLLVSGCQNEQTANIYDPGASSPAPQPTITSISPTVGLAGVTTITINGTNFSAVKEANTVYFETTQATVLTAGATMLTVKAPNLVKDSVRVRVHTVSSWLFSNSANCKLEAAVSEFGQLVATDEAWGMTSDAAGNLYVSMVSSGAGIGIKKFTPAGAKSDYAPTGGVTKWSSIKMGPLGEIYAARILRAIYKIPAGGGSPAIWVSFGNLGTVFDMDFDQNKNLWAGGNNTSVYRIKPDKDVKAFPFEANVRAVRVYNGYVYFGGLVTADNAEKVVRFRIVSADSLGAREEIFNLTTSPLGGAGKAIFAINFNTDGDMYIGTDATNPIIVVRADKSAEPLHPGLLSPTMHVFASGTGTALYAIKGTSSSGVVGSSGKIFKINPLKTLAPYYGTQ